MQWFIDTFVSLNM
jgi:hypothetical protein